MDVFEAVKKRRSVRNFKEDPFPEEILFQLLEAARFAPTAGNVQPWKFYIVKNKEIQSKLAEAALAQSWLTTPPVIIVVCAELARSAASYGQRGYTLYALQDTAAAIENILLCAVEKGLGCCWVGAFREEVVAQVLGLDTKINRPVAMIPIGYPAEEALVPVKRPLNDLIIFV